MLELQAKIQKNDGKKVKDIDDTHIFGMPLINMDGIISNTIVYYLIFL